MKVWSIAVSTAALFGMAIPSFGAQILINGGFETPDASAGDVANAPGAPWAGFNQGTLRYTTASQHNGGTQSVKTFGPFDGIGGGVGANETVAAVPGLSYSGGIFARQITGDALAGLNFGTYQLQFLDATSTPIGTVTESSHLTASNALDTWVPLTASLGVAPANAAFVRAQFVQVQLGDGNGNIAGGAIYWDDATVNAVAAPEPASLGALGLAAGLLARRRRQA